MKKKEKILIVARKLFSLKGYDGCSMDLIAAEAKVNKALIYYYYKDKAALYEQVIEKNLSIFYQRVELAVSVEDSPEKKLEAFARAYAVNFSSNKAMAPLMLRELASDGKHLTSKTRANLQQIIQLVDTILKEGQESGLFRETASFLPYFMIVGSMNIYTSTTRMRKQFQGADDVYGFSLTPEDTAAEIATIMINGLKSCQE